MIFPPVRLGDEYFGDGAMRQATPLSPAVRLGADRILVIGVRNEVPDPEPVPGAAITYPNLGSIAGYVLDALFMDGLYSDLERLKRINIMLEQLDHELSGSIAQLRPLSTLVIAPKEDMRQVAARHVHELPRAVRLLLRGLGAMNRDGMMLISYLLFESGFTRELIEMGTRDAMEVEDDLKAFLFD